MASEKVHEISAWTEILFAFFSLCTVILSRAVKTNLLIHSKLKIEDCAVQDGLRRVGDFHFFLDIMPKILSSYDKNDRIEAKKPYIKP